jgi:hypothetical protein
MSFYDKNIIKFLEPTINSEIKYLKLIKECRLKKLGPPGRKGNKGPSGAMGPRGAGNKYSLLQNQTKEEWYNVVEICSFCKSKFKRSLGVYCIELYDRQIYARRFNLYKTSYYGNSENIKYDICNNCLFKCGDYLNNVNQVQYLYSDLFQILNTRLHKNLVNMVIEYTSILATLSK